MPTPFSHLAVGFVVGAWAPPSAGWRRVCAVAAAAAALPDIDVISAPLHIPDTSLLSHRGITHSIAFAVVATFAATCLCFRGSAWAGRRLGIGLLLGLACLSHGTLDALTTYSVGIEFFAPFSQQRFRFGWTPLGDPHWGVAAQLVQEGIALIGPALLVGWLGLMRRPQYGERG